MVVRDWPGRRVCQRYWWQFPKGNSKAQVAKGTLGNWLEWYLKGPDSAIRRGLSNPFRVIP